MFNASSKHTQSQFKALSNISGEVIGGGNAREDRGMAQASLWDRLDTLIAQSQADSWACLEERSREQRQRTAPADGRADTQHSSAKVIVLDHWRLHRARREGQLLWP